MSIKSFQQTKLFVTHRACARSAPNDFATETNVRQSSSSYREEESVRGIWKLVGIATLAILACGCSGYRYIPPDSYSLHNETVVDEGLVLEVGQELRVWLNSGSHIDGKLRYLDNSEMVIADADTPTGEIHIDLENVAKIYRRQILWTPTALASLAATGFVLVVVGQSSEGPGASFDEGK